MKNTSVDDVFFFRYVVQQAAQELAAVEAEPIDSDSDMDENHYNSPAPEPSRDQPPSQMDTPQMNEVIFLIKISNS